MLYEFYHQPSRISLGNDNIHITSPVCPSEDLKVERGHQLSSIMSARNENHATRVVASSASATTLLIIIQMASKLVTFAANQSTLRNLSPAILGIATQLELYLVSVLYFSRESIRTAIQRKPLESSDLITSKSPGKPTTFEKAQVQSTATQSVVNISYLSPSIGILFALAFAAFYIHFASEEILQTPFYFSSVVVTGISSLLELGVEPFFAVVQQHMLYKKRAVVEMSAAFVKGIILCGVFAWAVWTERNVGVLPFALGYLGHSLTLICGYSIALLRKPSERQFSFLISRIESSDDAGFLADRFSRQLLSLSVNVFFQSVVKHLLTQGDSMILASVASLQDQGIYSLASNYGGLVARIFLQPIEESSRALFSSLLSSSQTRTGNSNAIGIAKDHLVDISRIYGVLSILIFPLGPVLVPQILHILGGRRWESPEVDGLISLYCYYIPFLAFNGITEAFVSSTASPSEVRAQTGWMGAFSACFALAAYTFLRIGNLGAYGLVWANIVNMAVRTIWSYCFIKSYFHRYSSDFSLADAGLHSQTYITGAIATAIMLAKQDYFNTGSQGTLKILLFSTIYALTV